MSRENVEIVRQVNEHLLTTRELALDLMNEDIEVHDHDAPDQGEYRAMSEWRGGSKTGEPPGRSGPTNLSATSMPGDIVVVFIRAKTTGHGSGVELERDDAVVYTLREGKIARVDYYNDRAEALEAVGLRE